MSVHSRYPKLVEDQRQFFDELITEEWASYEVIEHLPDPGVLMEFSASACRDGGHVAVVTPNVDRLDNRLRRWRGEPPGLVDPQHFREYSRRSLAALGLKHGLVPRDSFAYGLHSLLKPALTPRDYRRATRWGAWLPALALIIGVIFEKQVPK